MRTKPKRALRRVASSKRARHTRASNGFSSPEFRYLVEHCSELEKYRGEWLLLDGYSLVAHSPSFAEIKTVVAARKIASPFVHFVPVEDESVYVNL